MKTKRISIAIYLMVAIAALAQALGQGVTLQKADGRIDVLVDGKPFTSYYFSADAARPYLHPLRAADGRIVTRGFPMIRDAAGEEKDRDHPHHRSVWFDHGDVNGVDFWSSESAKVPGRIVHRSIEKMEGGAKSGVLVATADWIDNTGKKLLLEKTEIRFSGDATRRYLDFDITLTPVDQDVKFGDTKEGSFGIRLATPLKERNGGVIVNSVGGQGMKACWGKKAEWVDYSGKLGDSVVGVAILDHPGNLRHPTTWHVRDYGLFAVNPFGLRDFTGDKTQDGSYLLKKGENLRFRYRVLVHPGDSVQAKVAEEFKNYAR